MSRVLLVLVALLFDQSHGSGYKDACPAYEHYARFPQSVLSFLEGKIP